MAYVKLDDNVVITMGENQKALLVTGTSVPTDDSDGYGKGCLFIDTDVASGTSGLYVNIGTDTSCVFKLVSNAA